LTDLLLASVLNAISPPPSRSSSFGPYLHETRQAFLPSLVVFSNLTSHLGGELSSASRLKSGFERRGHDIAELAVVLPGQLVEVDVRRVDVEVDAPSARNCNRVEGASRRRSGSSRFASFSPLDSAHRQVHLDLALLLGVDRDEGHALLLFGAVGLLEDAVDAVRRRLLAERVDPVADRRRSPSSTDSSTRAS
jgi:hypothetical protein